MGLKLGLLYPMAPEEQSIIDTYGLTDYTYALKSTTDWQVRLSHVRTASAAHTVGLDEETELSNLLTAAESLREWDPSILVWACTRRSFLFGQRGAVKQISALEARFGIPAVSTSLAFSRAIEYLGLQSVAVLASYPLDVSEKFISFIREANCAVTELTVMDLPSGMDAARLGSSMLVTRATSMKLVEAEALLIPDTALHTLEVIETIEDHIGKLVLTANQVTLWHAFQRSGYRMTTAAFGRLFSPYTDQALAPHLQ